MTPQENQKKNRAPKTPHDLLKTSLIPCQLESRYMILGFTFRNLCSKLSIWRWNLKFCAHSDINVEVKGALKQPCSRLTRSMLNPIFIPGGRRMMMMKSKSLLVVINMLTMTMMIKMAFAPFAQMLFICPCFTFCIATYIYINFTSDSNIHSFFAAFAWEDQCFSNFLKNFAIHDSSNFTNYICCFSSKLCRHRIYKFINLTFWCKAIRIIPLIYWTEVCKSQWRRKMQKCPQNLQHDVDDDSIN